MSSNGAREDRNPNRLIGHELENDDIIIGNLLRAFVDEAESIRNTSAIINNSNNSTVLPTSSFHNRESLERATRDSGLLTSSSDFTTRFNPTDLGEDSAAQTITQDAELIASRALQSSVFAGPYGSGSSIEPDQTRASVDGHAGIVSNLRADGERATAGHRQSYHRRRDISADNVDSFSMGGDTMGQYSQYVPDLDHGTQSDLAIMESNRQHLLGLLDSRNDNTHATSFVPHPRNQPGSFGTYGTNETTEPYGSYGSYGMMPSASYNGHRLEYQPPAGYHHPYDTSSIDPNLALSTGYTRTNNTDEGYSHLYVDIPAPNSTGADNTFSNNQKEEEDVQQPVNTNSRRRPRVTRRKRKTTSDDNNEEEQNSHPTPAPRSRARARARSPRSNAAATSNATGSASTNNSNNNPSNDVFDFSHNNINTNNGSVVPAPVPAPAPAVPTLATNAAPSLTASLNDPDIPAVHRRRQPSVVDTMDPYTCHLCYHTCIRASTIREHYLQKHPELRLTKKNLHEYEPAKTANIKPLSFYKNQGLDTTYTGVDRKQVNARRRMDLGLRTTDPNYLRDVYKDTTAERTRAQRRAAKDEEDKKKKKKKKGKE
ncbi:hypothetical protein RBB50_009798 [Rhinocladiella similis]